MKNIFYASFLVILSAGACKNDATTTTTQKPEASTNSTTCYALHLGNDLTAIELNLSNDRVEGYFAWEPYEKDGARGKLVGTKSGDVITADFTYMIEGSVQAEEVIFKIAGEQLLQGQGELEERDGKMYLKDKNTLIWQDTFAKIACDSIHDAIGNAKDIYQIILKQQGAAN